MFRVPSTEIGLMLTPVVLGSVLIFLPGAILVDGLDDFGGFLFAGFELHARVEVFGVLADQDQIDGNVLEERPHAFILLAGPDTGVKSQLLPQVHVHAAETLADGRGDRGFECGVVFS